MTVGIEAERRIFMGDFLLGSNRTAPGRIRQN
jgi:hypothetical protein